MALDKRLIAQYKRLYPKWEQTHAKYWAQNAARPFVTSGGVTSGNIAQRARMEPRAKFGPFGGPDITRRVNPEEFKSNKALRNAIAAMRREIAPSYRRRRLEQQKKWMVRRLEGFGDAELTALAEELSLDAVEELYDFQDFGDILNAAVDIKDSDPLVMIDLMEEGSMVDSLKARVRASAGDLSKSAQRRVATKMRKADREAARARKRAEYMAEEQQRRAEGVEYNIRMARRGREFLERYGVQDLFGSERNMTREEWIASYSRYWA